MYGNYGSSKRPKTKRADPLTKKINAVFFLFVLSGCIFLIYITSRYDRPVNINEMAPIRFEDLLNPKMLFEKTYRLKYYYLFFAAVYIVGLIWYLRFMYGGEEKSKKSSHKESEQESRSEAKAEPKRRRKRGDGKRCPQCRKIIDRRRTICHHCGHEFEPETGIEPHPDEIKSGRRKPLDVQKEA